MQNDDYRTIGQMLATIIVQGGEHPRIFSPAICSYIAKGFDSCKPGIEEVPDPTVRNSLKKVVKHLGFCCKLWLIGYMYEIFLFSLVELSEMK